jgi:hypothetical protein
VSGALASADAQRIIDVALLAAFTGQHHRTGYFAPVGESFACQQQRNSRKATATDRKHMSVLLARLVFLGGCADHWLAADLRDHECRAVVAVGRLR